MVTLLLALIGAAIVVLVWCWVQFLPGYVIGRVLVPEVRGLARYGVSLICAFSVFPLLVFLISLAASRPMDALLLWAAATIVNIAGGFEWWRLGRAGLDVSRRDTLSVVAIALAAGLYLLLGLRWLDGGDALSTAHHCLYVVVMYAISNHPQLAVPMFDALSGDTLHFMVAHGTDQLNGLGPLFTEQRLGNAPLLAPPVALFGSLGWYLGSLLATVVTAVCVFLACRVSGAGKVAAGIATVVLCWGCHSLCGYVVNENYFATALVAFLLWAALKPDSHLGWALLCGAVAGHLVGVRSTSVLFWPGVAAGLLWRPAGQRFRGLAVAGLAALVTVLPWLYVNLIMLGTPFGHPKVMPEFGDRIVINELLGWSFNFKPLQWPFASGLVRAPWSPFPTALWLPLVVGQVFGQLFVATAAAGAWLLRSRRRGLVLLLVFAVPHTAAIAVMEGLDWAQLSYAAPGLVPLSVLIAAGLSMWPQSTSTPRRVGVIVATMAGIMVLTLGCRLLPWVEPDPRLLDDAHWDAPPPPDAGVRLVRKRLTALSPLPQLPVYRGQNLAPLLQGLAEIPRPQELPEQDGLPVYPSGKLTLLAGHSESRPVQYDFVLEGGAMPQPGKSVRTSLGLHTVSLRLAAERARVRVQRNQGRYDVDIEPLGRSAEPQDFTFWTNPWFPPVQELVVRVNGLVPDDVRTLEYGRGRALEGEVHLIVTNHPPAVFDVEELRFTVDTGGEAVHCGFFLFLQGQGPDELQTLTLAGGHDGLWEGERQGVLRVPRNLMADQLVLFSDPYCGMHQPQPGDRYAVAKGPFSADRPVHLTLDGIW